MNTLKDQAPSIHCYNEKKKQLWERERERKEEEGKEEEEERDHTLTYSRTDVWMMLIDVH